MAMEVPALSSHLCCTWLAQSFQWVSWIDSPVWHQGGSRASVAQQEKEMSWSRASGRDSGPEADTEKDGGMGAIAD